MGRGRVAKVDGIEAAQSRIQGLVEEAKLPTVGAPKSDSYEGDGYVIVKHRDTEVVRAACKTIVETIRVHYA